MHPQNNRSSDAVTFARLALALASDYKSVYVISTEDDSYVEYSAAGSNQELRRLSAGADFYADTRRNCRQLVFPEDQEAFLAAFHKETLLETLKNGESFSLNYRLVIDGKPQYFFLKTIRETNTENGYIIIGVQNIDTQMRREMAAAKEQEIFGEISKALARRYEVIYYVDILTDEYTEYSSSPQYAKLQVGKKGRNFFADTQENMKHDIYSEDYPMMAAAMEKENLLTSMYETGTCTLNYRLMLDGRPQYVSLISILPKEDSSHIIVAVANVDAAKRREIEFHKALGSAIDLANHDALTGVKNKHAYVRTEMEMDASISQKQHPKFAVVICDVNGLKHINDTQGHSAGDSFICDACAIICDIFKHSPVFRIGGDEFAVLLKGTDYENRASLMQQFRLKMKENYKNNLVTAASGISDYDESRDIRVQDVFERADRAMYQCKEKFRQL